MGREARIRRERHVERAKRLGKEPHDVAYRRWARAQMRLGLPVARDWRKAP